MPSPLYPWMPALHSSSFTAFAMAATQSPGSADASYQSPLHFASHIATNASQIETGQRFALPQSLAAERQASSAGASTSSTLNGDSSLGSSQKSAPDLHFEARPALRELELKERAISAAAAAFLSAVIVNPLDVAKVTELANPPFSLCSACATQHKGRLCDVCLVVDLLRCDLWSGDAAEVRYKWLFPVHAFLVSVGSLESMDVWEQCSCFKTWLHLVAEITLALSGMRETQHEKKEGGVCLDGVRRCDWCPT